MAAPLKPPKNYRVAPRAGTTTRLCFYCHHCSRNIYNLRTFICARSSDEPMNFQAALGHVCDRWTKIPPEELC